MKRLKKYHLLGLAVVVSMAGNGVLYYRYQKAVDANPNVQTDRIIGTLRKTTALPDEQPSVMTVVDKTKLANPAIAQVVENGDKILMFQQAKKMIVYRPASGKLVTIFSLSSDAAAGQPRPTR